VDFDELAYVAGARVSNIAERLLGDSVSAINVTVRLHERG
jgi:hypothetical protein